MRKLTRATCLLAALPAALLLTASPGLAADQTIDAFEAGQQAAWNAHDARAYTAAFDPAAEIITVLGWHWRGQAEAASNLGDGFKLVYARAQLHLADMRIRMLTPELASVTLRWSIDGARAIDGGVQTAEQQGL